MKINGKVVSWSDIVIYLGPIPYKVAGITDISYSVEQEKEDVYGMGTEPLGSGHGNKKASGSFTLTRAESDTFEAPARAVGKTSVDYAPFTIVIAYADKEQDGLFIKQKFSPTKVDTLTNVEITKIDFKGSQNDKNLSVSYTFRCTM